MVLTLKWFCIYLSYWTTTTAKIQNFVVQCTVTLAIFAILFPLKIKQRPLMLHDCFYDSLFFLCYFFILTMLEQDSVRLMVDAMQHKVFWIITFMYCKMNFVLTSFVVVFVSSVFYTQYKTYGHTHALTHQWSDVLLLCFVLYEEDKSRRQKFWIHFVVGCMHVIVVYSWYVCHV